MCRIFNDYIELARKNDIIIDTVCAILLSSVITFLVSWLNISSHDLISKILDFTKIVIPTFAIQAGFHGTSLSIFSSSNTGMAKYLKENRIENTNRRLIEQVYAYFAWSFIVQLFLLFSTIITYYLVSYLPEGYLGATLSCYISAGLLFGVIYALMLTMRNIQVLYFFLIASARRFESKE